MSDRSPADRPPLARGDHAYDPQLPFLAELERELDRHARRERARQSSPGDPTLSSDHTDSHGHRPDGEHTQGGHAQGRRASGHASVMRQPGRQRAGSPRSSRVYARVARRSLTLVALLCLIAASAYGAHQVFSAGSGASAGDKSIQSPATPEHGVLVLAARGSSGAEHWSLDLYSRGSEECRVLTVAEDDASRCAPPPAAGTVAAMSVLTPLRRYVFGVTGKRVDRVAVRAGASAQVVATHALGPSLIRDTGLPADTRYFVAVLARPLGALVSPTVARGLDGAGRPVGPAVASCPQTSDSQPCSGG